jgi:hypothetical protein
VAENTLTNRFLTIQTQVSVPAEDGSTTLQPSHIFHKQQIMGGHKQQKKTAATMK